MGEHSLGCRRSCSDGAATFPPRLTLRRTDGASQADPRCAGKPPVRVVRLSRRGFRRRANAGRIWRKPVKPVAQTQRTIDGRDSLGVASDERLVEDRGSVRHCRIVPPPHRRCKQRSCFPTSALSAQPWLAALPQVVRVLSDLDSGNHSRAGWLLNTYSEAGTQSVNAYRFGSWRSALRLRSKRKLELQPQRPDSTACQVALQPFRTVEVVSKSLNKGGRV